MLRERGPSVRFEGSARAGANPIIDGRVGDKESARDEGRDSDERIADHVRALGLHIAEQESPVGKDLRQEGESARPHAEQFRHQEMTQFVQQHAREKQHREETDRQTWVARDDEEDRLNLAVQKPLEKNQRQKREEKPGEASEHEWTVIRRAQPAGSPIEFCPPAPLSAPVFF